MRAYQKFLLTVAAGMPGILAVVFLVPPPPDVHPVVLAVNPTILLVIAAIAGPFAVRRMQLRSTILLGDFCPVRGLVLAFGSGVVMGGVLTGLDCATVPIWRGAMPLPQSLCQQHTLDGFVLGVLYGGITEELIMRWGLLSIVAFGLSRLIARSRALAVSVIFSATVFALAHMPAVWLAVAVE